MTLKRSRYVKARLDLCPTPARQSHIPSCLILLLWLSFAITGEARSR
jgi:hypothetical protein